MAKAGRSISELLEDLLQWGEEAKGIADGRSKDDFLQDRLAQLAPAKAMEVVGEIAGRLIRHHPDWAGSRRETGLDGAYRFRNRISHGYDSIDFVLVWEIARKDLPDLLEHARKWLAEKPQ